MAKKKVTSSDVAKRAGVSQATVSMVLNKKYNVSFSKEVIQKVEAATRKTARCHQPEPDKPILCNAFARN